MVIWYGLERDHQQYFALTILEILNKSCLHQLPSVRPQMVDRAASRAEEALELDKVSDMSILKEEADLRRGGMRCVSPRPTYSRIALLK